MMAAWACANELALMGKEVVGVAFTSADTWDVLQWDGWGAPGQQQGAYSSQMKAGSDPRWEQQRKRRKEITWSNYKYMTPNVLLYVSNSLI